MKLYSYYRSTSSYRVRIALNCKALTYEYQAVDLSPEVTEQDASGFERVNAMRQVPVLEWQDRGHTHRLSQSVAIIEFLEESTPNPALLPASPLERARVRELVEIVNSGIQPHQNSRTLSMLRERLGQEAATAWARDAIARGLHAAEELGRRYGGEFLVGDRLSLAEVFVVPQLYNARRFGVDVGVFEKLAAVDARCGALDPFVRAHPNCQPDAFSTYAGGP